MGLWYVAIGVYVNISSVLTLFARRMACILDSRGKLAMGKFRYIFLEAFLQAFTETISRTAKLISSKVYTITNTTKSLGTQPQVCPRA